MDHAVVGTISRVEINSITKLYAAVWSQLTLISSGSGSAQIDLAELTNELILLRKHLVCPECQNIVPKDFVVKVTPPPQSSLNLVCKVCDDDVKMKEHPDFSSCLDADQLQLLHLVLESYKEFCALFIQMKEFQTIIEEKSKIDPTFDALLLIKLLTEAALRTITTELYNSETEDVSSCVGSNSKTEVESIPVEDLNHINSISGTDTSIQHFNVNVQSGRSEPGASRDASMIVKPIDPFQNVSIKNAGTMAPISEISRHCTLSGPESQKIKRSLKVQLPNKPAQTSSIVPSVSSKKGCWCGHGTNTSPGTAKCCGKRCPCYVGQRICIGCKCKGCKNPAGKKSLLSSRTISSQSCSTERTLDDRVIQLGEYTTNGTFSCQIKAEATSSAETNLVSSYEALIPSPRVDGLSSKKSHLKLKKYST